MVVERGLEDAGTPVAGGFVTAPRPVQYMVSKSPELAGWDCAPWMLPEGAAKMDVFAIWMAPCPVPPGGMVKMPGEYGPRGTVCGALVRPPAVTWTVAEAAPASSSGTSTLSCVGKEENRGAGIPLKVTPAPPSVASSFPSLPKGEDGWLDPSFRLVPNMAAIVPGARGLLPAAKLALLTVPLLLTVGGAAPGCTIADVE